ncbi:MAG: hypothetical protein GY906_10180 [bacterium]|nr:hypothetical protein [bacterium]
MLTDKKPETTRRRILRYAAIFTFIVAALAAMDESGGLAVTCVIIGGGFLYARLDD